ncbi:hypothetical protein GSI_11997 [Ganoderma sinense ZZ0214-1]|uniref:Uncharacterized protein n=1 Tax=Ganoderma sinense ZZ0214-1 TaxID=1077348 RepID=A0A2G8RXJ7_9APHY|nr:hypothetical protein GSI_11997 [Ganoderma sinense ZZ0214-1]
MEAADDLLAKYKKHPFAKGLLPFQSCMEALGTSESKIRDKATRRPALFSHAAVFAEADHPETGNYVPPDEAIPFGVDPKNVQRKANTRCFYTYILDTFTDISLYEGQWTLDEYVSGLPGFNARTVPRRAYLSGQDVRYRTRFWMQTPMFLRKGAQKEPSIATGHLHPWVVEADKQSKGFRGNPDRPRVWVKDGDDIVPISEREPGTLQRGDVVALSFTVTYHITTSNWFPQFHPADIIVLQSGDGDVPDYSAPEIDLYSRPPPSFGMEDPGDSDVEGSKEARRTGGGEGDGEMEDVVDGSMELRADNGGSGQHMDVQAGGRQGGTGSSVTLGSSGEGGHEAFELVPPGGGDDDNEDDEFVDVEAQEEVLRPLRSGRSGRKRL